MRVENGRLAALYGGKPAKYFSGARPDIVAELTNNPNAAILEIGCGFGGTGELALSKGKCRKYVGVEISESAAAVARHKITSVIVGNVETIEFPWAEQSFDALIMSEVLEHLVDPWRALKRLAPLMRGGALVMASSPNVSQYKVIASLVAGRWDLTDSGVLDRTHLRWFTPNSYKQMFEQAGFVVDQLDPLAPFSRRTKLINRLTLGRFQHLFIRQIKLIGHRVV